MRKPWRISAFLEQLRLVKNLLHQGQPRLLVGHRRQVARAFCEDNGFTTLELLHNNCYFYGDYALCGTRGWFLEEEQKPHNAKVLNRELLRLETSLKAAGERPIFCFLHYPPLYQGYQCPEILSLLETYQVELCCYGHLHGAGHPPAAGGSMRKYGIFSDLRRLSGVSYRKKFANK